MGKQRRDEQPIRNISWDEFDSLSKNLVNQLPLKLVRRYGPGFPENAAIWGIPRGGLIVALRLSYLQPEFIFKDLVMLTSNGGFIIDDVVDSGKTMGKCLKGLNMNGEKVKIASLFYRHSSIVVPDYYVEEIPDDTWIEFPWEKE